MTEEDQLTQLCQRLGSPEAQARVMARQLLKRAEQISQEKGVSREDAMTRLLKVLMEGRQGRVV